MRRFNDLADFSREEIQELIGLAARLDRNPEPRALAGKVLSLLFLSPSLRTLSSFQAAMIRLGGGAFVISPDMSIHGLESRYGIVMDGTAAEHVRPRRTSHVQNAAQIRVEDQIPVLIAHRLVPGTVVVSVKRGLPAGILHAVHVDDRPQ